MSVIGDATGYQIDVRTLLSDKDTSLLANKQSVEITAEGKVAVFLEDDANIGRQAEIVLLDPSGKVIDSMSTTLGE